MGVTSVRLNAEVEVPLEDLAQRMKYASMAPLLDILHRIEEHMTEFFQHLAQESSYNDAEQIESEDRPPSSPRRSREFDEESGARRPTRSIPLEGENGEDRRAAEEEESLKDHGGYPQSNSIGSAADDNEDADREYRQSEENMSRGEESGSVKFGRDDDVESYDGAYREVALSGSFDDLIHHISRWLSTFANTSRSILDHLKILLCTFHNRSQWRSFWVY